MKIKTGAVLFFLILLVAPLANADFEYLGMGARPTGLGNSYTALADDSYGVYFNPGGICFARYPSVSAEYSKLWMGLGDGSNLSNGSLNYVHPLAGRKTALGLSWQSFGLTGYYSENIMSFAWARRMSKTLGLGVGLKYLSQNYIMDEYTLGSYAGLGPDPVFDAGKRTSKNTFAVDPGLLWNFYPDYFAGISIININQPDIGLAEKEILPMILNIGFAYRYDYLRLNKFNLGIGATFSDGEFRTNAGIEKWFGKRTWAIRAGTGFGARQYFSMAIGATVAFKSARIDYSMILPLGQVKNDGTHRISLVFEFSPQEAKNFLEEGDEAKMIKQAKKDIAEAQSEGKKLKNKILELETKLDEAKRSSPADVNYLNDKIRYLEEQLKQTQQQKKAPGAPATTTPAAVAPAALPGITPAPVIPAEQQPAVPSSAYPPETQAPFAVPDQQQQPPAPVFTTPSTYTPPVYAPPPESVVPPAVPAPTPKKPATAAKPKTTTHTVSAGESLPSIAQKYYGDSSQWRKIYEANKSKIKRGQVEPGQELTIP